MTIALRLSLALIVCGCGGGGSAAEGLPNGSAGGAADNGNAAMPGENGAKPSAGGPAHSAGTGGASSLAGSAAGGRASSNAGGGGMAGSETVSEAGASGAAVLDGSLPPSANFDLSRWSITFPDASQEMEAWLIAGNQRPEEFFTDPETGGMVFRVPNIAASTPNSNYSRSELREMLRAGDTEISVRGLNANNWVFSSSSAESEAEAGGVDGTLSATLRVDHVSTSGDAGKIGRVIVGQIHASENEPCRLYYRKLPGNSRGSLYFAHEPNEGEETFVELLGSRENDAVDPPDGVALGEVFSYQIAVRENTLSVSLERAGSPMLSQSLDMADSGFADDWMYFKAGAYNQNNTGTSEDYAQTTFFALEVGHD